MGPFGSILFLEEGGIEDSMLVCIMVDSFLDSDVRKLRVLYLPYIALRSVVTLSNPDAFLSSPPFVLPAKDGFSAERCQSKCYGLDSLHTSVGTNLGLTHNILCWKCRLCV